MQAIAKPGLLILSLFTVLSTPVKALELEQKPGELTVSPRDVVHWSAGGASIVEENQVDVGLRLGTSRGFALYANRIKFTLPFGFTETGRTEPSGALKPDPISGEPVELIDSGDFNIRMKGPVRSLGDKFDFAVTFTACAEGVCLFPYTETLTVTLDSTGASTTQGESDFESNLAKKLQSGSLSIWALLAIVFIGGLLTNMTPCVAPMLPITIRVLGGRDGHGLRNASLYASGILVTYTIAGVAAGLSGGLFGSILANAQFNLFFAAVMAALGITMLGYGDFSALQNLGMKFGSGKPSVLNMFMMGAGAGLVASPCTGPILAALLAYTAKSASFVESVALIATYSLGFSLPYVFLGGAAAKVSRVKVNFRVQIATKLLFAAIMFALSLYYLRVPAYPLLVKIKPYFATMAAIFAPLGIAMLLVWILVPYLHNSKARTIPPAIVLAIGIFSGSQLYFMKSDSTNAGGVEPLSWLHDESMAFTLAKEQDKPILIDAWAEWCDACKKMDITTFADPDVTTALKAGWILLKLDLTEGSDANDALQEKYELQSLPTLTMIPPSGDLDRKEPILGYTPAATLLQRIRAFAMKQKEPDKNHSGKNH